MGGRRTHLLVSGHRRAHRLLERYGTELRVARAAAGMSQAQVAARVGVSQAFVSLVEHGDREPTWGMACALAGAVGHDFSLRLFPASSVRLRDSGQLGLIGRIVSEAHESWHRELERPISSSSSDRRAADLVLVGRHEVLHVEVERRIVDLQAQLRAAQLKRASLAGLLDRSVRLVIAVPDTRHVRRLITAEQAAIRAALPQSSTSVWRSIRTGAELGADGLAFIRPASSTTAV